MVCCVAFTASARADGTDEASRALSARAARFDAARGAGQLRPLLGIEALDDTSFDRGAALLAFLRHAEATAQEPLVAARAHRELARLLSRRGRRQSFGYSAGGYVEGVAIVGPFSAELGAELPASEKLGPEDALLRGVLAPDATFPSGLPAQPARVHRLDALESDGSIPIRAVLRPESRVAAFAIFSVETPRATTVVLRVGSNGATVAWLNGRRLGEHTGERPLALDADGWVAPLSKGLNRFVVRVATGEHAPELVARLTDERGAGLSMHRADALAAPVAASKSPLPPAMTLATLLRGPDRDAYLVNDEISGPRPEAPCGRLSEHLTASSRGVDESTPLEIIEGGPSRPPSLGVAQRGSPHRASRARSIDSSLLPFALQCAVDDDAQRRLLEARLLDTTDRLERIALLTKLGELQMRGRTPSLAEQRLVEAASQGNIPETWRARFLLVDVEVERGLVQTARAELAALAKAAPSHLARTYVAYNAQRAGRAADALELQRALFDELPGDTSLLRQTASMLRTHLRRQDLEQALALLSAPHDAGDDRAFVVDRAELLEGLGRVPDAVRELEALLQTAPGDASIEERLGRLLLGSGHKDDALVHLRRGLELKPQSPELRGLLGDIDGTRDGGLRHRFAVDVAALRDRAARNPLGRTDPARVLYDATTVHVHDNGLQESFVERVVEVHDRRGAEQEATAYVRYAPDTQSVDLEVARVYKASGEIVEVATIDEQDLSEPWAGLYYDVRAKVVHLSGVEPGDVVHVAYTLSDQGRRNELGDAFCDLHMLQEGMARLETTYRLLAPKTRAIYFNEPRVGKAVLVPAVVDSGDERSWEVTARDVPKLVTEPGMPGEPELGAHVNASTFATWSDVAAFYRGLSLGQLEPDVAIRRAAQAAVAGKVGLEDKVAAIYDLVVRSTRYVGLEFGVHGYQPYKVSQVWARRFGDCKDKASLLVAMLKEVGVPATLVLLRTLHEGAIERSPPSLALFDHAIAYVPALDRYLDGTAELSGSTELPSEDQGTFGLHIADGVLHVTPVDGPDAARTDERLDVELAADGSAKVALVRHIAGVAAEEYRREYLPVAQRKEHLEQAWGQRSPGAVVEEVSAPHLDDRERPVELSATLKLPRLARSEAGSLAVPVLLREPRLVSTLAPLSVRVQDDLLSHAFSHREHVTLRLPKGAHAQLPDDVVVQSPFGRFTLHGAVTTDGRVEIDAETTLAVRRVSVADYTAFRTFLTAIDRAVGSELRVELAK